MTTNLNPTSLADLARRLGALTEVLWAAPLAIAGIAGRASYSFQHRTRHALIDYVGVVIVLGALALTLVSLGGA